MRTGHSVRVLLAGASSMVLSCASNVASTSTVADATTIRYESAGEYPVCGEQAELEWTARRARVVSVDSWTELPYALFACVTFELQPLEGEAPAELEQLHMHDARIYLVALPYVRRGDVIDVRVNRSAAPGRQIVLDYGAMGLARPCN